MNAAPLLCIQNLNVTIAGTQVLKSLTLDVAPGEILALVGESGSGKSMTARAILGLLPPGGQATGSITLSGRELLGLDDGALRQVRGRQIGLVSQEPMTALNPVLTIGDQVAECFRLHQGVSQAEALRLAQETLERVELPAARFPLSRYPHELSGGQRQRVAIAIAIALKPRLLIADEPTTALDVTTQAQIMALLRALVRDSGIGIVLITHDLGVVAEAADRVAVMHQGAIVEAADTLTLFGQMRHPYTRALLAAATYVPPSRPVPVPRPGEPPVLSVQGVVREYAGPRRGLFTRPPRFRAVDAVGFTIAPGESLGLVGESGCGKSTLLRAILALDRLQGGEVLVAGEDFGPDHPAALRRLRARIQVVFQDPFGSFNPRWTVERLVAENFHLLDQPPSKAEQRRRVQDLLERMGLQAGDADRYPHEFSGGQRQRIAIARALITQPRVIALDEAVSALDVTVRRQILDLLADLSRQQGLSYLFVTHDLSVVRAITDKVAVMQGGRIVEIGDTDQVFAHPQHPYTQSLLAATPDIDRALAARRAVSGPVHPA